MKTLRMGVMAVSAAVLLGVALDADAASVRVQCETRATRSRVSVDGNDLAPGAYTARITSGANVATSMRAGAIGDEAEFDFDSKPKNVAAGATQIGRTFIQNNAVKGELLDASDVVVANLDRAMPGTVISPRRDRDEVARVGDFAGLARRRRIIWRALGVGAVLSLSILGASGGARATGHAWEDALRLSVRDSDYVLEYAPERGGRAAVPVAVRLYPRAQAGRTMSFDRAGETEAAPGIRDPAERTQAIGVLRRARDADSVPLPPKRS